MQQIIKQLTERCDQYSSELPHEHNEPSYFQLWGRFDELRRVLRELKELEATPVAEELNMDIPDISCPLPKRTEKYEVAPVAEDWKEKLDAAAKEYAKDFQPHDCEKDFINVQENAIVDYKEGAYWGRKQTLHEIDMELAALEDVLHGEEGEAVTTLRVKIQQQTKTPQ